MIRLEHFVGKFYIHDDDTILTKSRECGFFSSLTFAGYTLQSSLRIIVSVLLDLFKASASCCCSGWSSTCFALNCYLYTCFLSVPKCWGRVQNLFFLSVAALKNVFCFIWRAACVSKFASLISLGPLTLVNIHKYKSVQVSVIHMCQYRGINENIFPLACWNRQKSLYLKWSFFQIV